MWSSFRCTAPSVPDHDKVYKELAAWVHDKAMRLPTRCAPVVCGDANVRMSYAQTVAHPHQIGRVVMASAANRHSEVYANLMHDCDLCPANAWRSAGDTYYSVGSSSSSRIDYVSMPRGVLHGALSRVKVDDQAAPHLQLIRSRYRAGHVPLTCSSPCISP